MPTGDVVDAADDRVDPGGDAADDIRHLGQEGVRRPLCELAGGAVQQGGHARHELGVVLKGPRDPALYRFEIALAVGDDAVHARIYLRQNEPEQRADYEQHQQFRDDDGQSPAQRKGPPVVGLEYPVHEGRREAPLEKDHRRAQQVGYRKAPDEGRHDVHERPKARATPAQRESKR